jgi:hypothetical protein
MENEEGSMLGDVVSSDGTLMLQLLMKESEELIKFKKGSPAVSMLCAFECRMGFY